MGWAVTVTFRSCLNFATEINHVSITKYQPNPLISTADPRIGQFSDSLHNSATTTIIFDPFGSKPNPEKAKKRQIYAKYSGISQTNLSKAGKSPIIVN